jgi:multicomponent Na+:H+ antiporter subunit B
MKNNNGMTEIVKTITALVEAAIFIYAVNITIYGHISPGGGFSGGVILAFLFILLFLSYGKKEAFKKFRLKEEIIFNSIGLIGALFLFSFLLYLGGHYIGDLMDKIYTARPYTLLSGGGMLIEDLGIALKGGAAVFMVFAVLSVFGHRDKN